MQPHGLLDKLCIFYCDLVFYSILAITGAITNCHKLIKQFSTLPFTGFRFSDPKINKLFVHLSFAPSLVHIPSISKDAKLLVAKLNAAFGK